MKRKKSIIVSQVKSVEVPDVQKLPKELLEFLAQLPGVIIKHKKIGAEFDPDEHGDGGGEEDPPEPKMTLKKLAEIVIEGFKKQDEFNHKQEDFNAYIEKKIDKLETKVDDGFKKQDEFNHKQEDFNAYIEKKIDKLETKVDDGFKKQDEFNNYIKNEVEELKVAQRKTDEKLEKVIKLNNLKS